MTFRDLTSPYIGSQLIGESMCIGAITRAERDRDDGGRWKRMLAGRIQDISHFG